MTSPNAVPLPAKPADVQPWLDAHFAAVTAAAGVPGAAIAVLTPDGVASAAAGVTSLATGVDATVDTVFQIGSITKLWTATLVMGLVDDGILDLDAPIQRYLPEFTLADKAAAAQITARHLLSHTAGFEGDVFNDTGRGEDAIAKYIESIAEVPQLFPPGQMFSYNNAGFVVLGRLVEVLRGQPFDKALTERIAAPLGLAHVAPSPYEAILHRTAVGHLPGEDSAPPVPAPLWAMAPSNAPAGAMLAMTATDLVAFARAHIDGTAILAPGTSRTMAAPQVGLPPLGGMGEAWGLGFEVMLTGPAGADFPTVIGHDGNTVGQSAFLRIAPAPGIAIALLTNGTNAFGLFDATVVPLLRALTGIALPSRPAPAARPPEMGIDRCLGTYSCSILDMVVSRDDAGTIWVDQVPGPVMVDLGGQAEHNEYVPFAADSLIQREPTSGLHPVLVFIGQNDAGQAELVHFGRVIARA
jgi:CubicO group peptidase (beta-lactamase class C family)